MVQLCDTSRSAPVAPHTHLLDAGESFKVHAAESNQHVLIRLSNSVMRLSANTCQRRAVCCRGIDVRVRVRVCRPAPSIDDESRAERCRPRIRPALYLHMPESVPRLALLLGSITRPHRGVEIGNYALHSRLGGCGAERERDIGAGDVHGEAGGEVRVVRLESGGGSSWC